jgi:rhodanese-related sulfurtransferase
MLYDSLHSKLLTLPDDVLVYPAHGAGSLCGRNMRADRFSTIGTERLTNYALQIRSREEFIRQMTANLPARPEYFVQDAQINRHGAGELRDLPALASISAAELQQLIEQDVFALDVRPASDFAAAHVPGSINIALSGQFASWAASVLGLNASPVLIADTPQQYEEARVRLARVGIEDVRGYLEGGTEGWRQAGFGLEKLPQITARELAECVREGMLRVLDVRREPEWQAGHIRGADWWPLDRFKVSPPELAPDVPLAVHCASGYRSVIACSLLRRAGMKNVLNVIGGFGEWQKAGLDVEKAEAAAVS